MHLMDNVPHCKMIEDMLNQTRQEVEIQFALRLIARCYLSDEEIAEVVELSPEEVTELRALASDVTT